ncbi:MAG TPA: CoA pyrophosphatase [Stellaceae bacterium]|nr:CoA pyrophosphatase [Stellaceae bacterium]
MRTAFGGRGACFGQRGDHGGVELAGPPIRAAVLVPLALHPDGMRVLLTLRSPHLAAHAGQVSFPGGRIEPEDPDPVAAALRETWEEVGIGLSHIEVVGRLDTYLTGTGFEITPIVGLVRVPYELVLDPIEVAEAFEVPLAFILDRANHATDARDYKGKLRQFSVIRYGRHTIWGATAGMLVNLTEVLAP